MALRNPLKSQVCRKSMWVITANWYDSINHFATGPFRTRAEAIEVFMMDWKDQHANWRSARNYGWRAVKVNVTWLKP